MKPTDLTTTGRLVLAMMALLQGHGRIWVSKRYLETATNVPKRTVLSVLQDMERYGWVEAYASVDHRGNHNPTLYRLTSLSPSLIPEDCGLVVP